MGFTIYVRDRYFNRVAEITDFQSLELLPRFNNVGSFILDLATHTFAAKELIKQKAGIIVVKDGQTIFSGQVTNRKRSFNTSGDRLTVSGKDDMFFLSSRLGYPSTNGNFASADYNIRTGKAETIMKQYVDYNCGQNALVERRTLTIDEDSGLGNTVTGRARFDNLLDLLNSLALKGGGLGFNVIQEGNSLVFKVYQPSDKTRSAFFSPLLGNVSSFEYSNDNPEANHVIVAGGGEGASRVFVQKSDNTSVANYYRIETFIDQRNTSDLAELGEALNEELVTKAQKNSFNFTPVDTPQLSFGKHYNLGDKVSIVITQPYEVVSIETLYHFISAYQTVETTIEKVQRLQEKLQVIQDVVREVKIMITPEGESISPVVGTDGSLSNSALKIFDKMNKLNKRLSNLERS